ncbi:MAG: chemotaxis protein CheW [Proteobacteria bacterium]|nr:chemotaxis protein CheW [Pseudomonadota bacterium]
MSQSTSDLASDKVTRKTDTVARRTRLREFQAQLVARMQAARANANAQVNQLGVMIGNRPFLLNLQEAGEILSVGAMAKVPLTHDWFLGLANVRGNLISVVDLARFQGQASTPIERESRIIVFAPTLSFNCGLLVSRVLGLRNVAEMRVQDVDAEHSAAPWCAQQYADRDSRVWTELNLSLIVQDQQFLQVGL